MNITREQIDELERFAFRIGIHSDERGYNAGTIKALIDDWRLRQAPVIDQRVCKHCLFPKGKHFAEGLECPSIMASTTFDPVEP